jgi:hypothetical protein
MSLGGGGNGRGVKKSHSPMKLLLKPTLPPSKMEKNGILKENFDFFGQKMTYLFL